MVCPYAKKRGPVVYCEIQKKRVSPLKYPCLTDKWHECEVIKKVKRAEEGIQEVEVQMKESDEKPEIQSQLEKFTCLQCPFYSKLTGKCVKYKIKVENPEEPPCRALNFAKGTRVRREDIERVE